jgi:hypothetical protein
MTIKFKIDNADATYSRSWFSGRAFVDVDGMRLAVQSPWNPATHFSLQLCRSWACNVMGHRLFIESTRPRILAFARAITYRVSVDGKVIAERSGY